jgi:hypothetical protein
MAKPVKKVTKGISKGLSLFDRTIGLQGQVGVFKRGFKDILGVPEYEQAKPAIKPKAPEQAQTRPLATRQQAGDNQESSSRELYRRRRARGMASGPVGLMGQNINRKTLLGE